MKKICLGFIVLLLVGGMLLFGCSNSAAQINNAVDSSVASETQQKQTESQKSPNPKLVEIYNNGIKGYVKFDKDGKLWEKYNGSDQIRETSELIDYNIYRIYETDTKKTEYVSTIKTNMNNNTVLSEEYEKVIDNSSTKISINEYNEIKNKFEIMYDYYDDLINSSKSLSANFSSYKSDNEENVELTKNIYWYVTDDETILHFSSVTPLNANYNEWQNDYIEFCKSFEDNSYIIKKEQVNNIVDLNSLMTIPSYNAQNGYKKNDRKTYKNDGYILVTKDKYFEKIKRIIIDNKIVLNSYDYFFGEFKSVDDIINIENLDLSLATSISHMFDGCSSLKKLDLSTFNTKNVIDMSSMFNNCESLIELNISNFNTENVVNMNSMFCYCIELQMLNIINFDTSNVTDMARMFSECYKLKEIDISNFNTKNVENMNYMFTCCEQLENINVVSFDTSKVKEMTGMFYGCIGLKSIDLSGFDFSNVGLSIWGPESYTVAGIAEMFSGCKNLQTIYSGQDIHINGFFEKTPVFKDCFDLVGGNGTKYNDSFNDISFAIIDTVYQMGYFTYDPSRYYWKDGKYYVNGNLQKNKWITDIDNKYYLDNNGSTLKNQWKDNKYLGEDGKMLKNTYTPDNKYVNKDGNVVDLEKDFANIDKETVQLNAWYRTDNGVWYYFEGDRDTLKKGWFTDPQDSQTYYLDPTNGVMLTGWQTIDGNEYYFNTRSASEPNWYYVEDSDIWLSYGKKIKALGSMFRDEETPDGKRVDADGKLIK